MNGETEPALAVEEIQGHVFPGFGSAFAVVAAFRLETITEARSAIAELLPSVTNMAKALHHRDLRREAKQQGEPVPPIASLAIAFSAQALARLGMPTAGADPNFDRGMLQDLRTIGDPLGEDDLPSDWRFGHTDETRIDLLLVGGESSEPSLNSLFEKWCGILSSGWALVHWDFARRREDDKEFFGFNDGVSQPGIRGLRPDGTPLVNRPISSDDPRSLEFARPGQRLVWPGNFILGYQREVEGNSPGSIFEPPQSWMRNGSYLVYRRLNQNPERFREAVEGLRAYLASQGEIASHDWLSARLVGRWKDGTPVVMSPDGPNTEIGKDVFRNNNFRYAFGEQEIKVTQQDGSTRIVMATPGDPRGKLIPLMAHIRQINPRAGQSEEGAEQHPQKLMLRRGVTFGKEIEEDPEGERGLIFLAYQTSISRQFLFVQSTWANSANAPTSWGPDPIISQDGTASPKRRIRVFVPSGRPHDCPFNGRWVIPTAGEYLFLPSLTGLKELCQS